MAIIGSSVDHTIETYPERTICLNNNRTFSLYLFYALNFLAVGMTTFAAKFYGEIGLSDSQIGIISALAAFIALFAQPMWGMLADRMHYMRTALVIGLVCAGFTCFLVLPASGSFLPLLAVLTLYSTFYLPAMPVSNAIAIEYTSKHNLPFGPIRMTGTIGYQISILITGFLLAGSLMPLYPLLGVILIIAGLSARLMPPIHGEQHRDAPVSLSIFLKDPALLLLFLLAFLASIGHQFNLSFFSKFLGDLGMDNTTTGIISTLSVVFEVPFLLFGDRIARRFTIWTWMSIGLAVGAVRFLLLSVVHSPALIIITQSLSIAHLACFEFIPFIYLGRRTRKELLSSVQSLYTTITFGLSRIIGTLFGGFIADTAGIAQVYRYCGLILLAALIIFYIPMRRTAALERQK